jgi:hypothetical protein
MLYLYSLLNVLEYSFSEVQKNQAVEPSDPATTAEASLPSDKTVENEGKTLVRTERKLAHIQMLYPQRYGYTNAQAILLKTPAFFNLYIANVYHLHFPITVKTE